jgi:hypothetical protein
MPMQNRSLEELQQKADVLSLHIPWTPETNKMVCFYQCFCEAFLGLNTLEEEYSNSRFSCQRRPERWEHGRIGV